MTVHSLYLIVLFGTAIQLPLSLSSVADGIIDLDDILPVLKQSNDTLHLPDVKVQVNNNALALSQMNTLVAQLLRVLTINSSCSEEAFATHVTRAMVEGFSQMPRLFRYLLQSLSLLKLTNWRIDLVRSLGVAEVTAETPCPLPFFIRNEKCIYVEIKTMRSFKYAKMVCRAMGGYLIEPHDLKDFAAFIEEIVIRGRNNQQVSSASRVLNTREVFVGGVKQEDSETWQWLSGSIIENIPWDNRLEVSANRAKCLSVKGNLYKDIACENLRYFACERPM